jgi:hypothetical protein
LLRVQRETPHVRPQNPSANRAEREQVSDSLTLCATR